MAGACGKILTLWLLLAVCALPCRAQGCQEGTAYSIMQAGNATATFKATGTFWPFLMQVRETEYLFKVNDSVGTMIFTGGLWMSGKDRYGTPRAAASFYDQQLLEYAPGPMGHSGTPSPIECLAWDRFFSVSRQRIEAQGALAVQYQTKQGGQIPLHLIHGSIRNWPAAGNPYFTTADGTLMHLDTARNWAPFVDTDQDGIYDPTRGDYPMVRGDQNTWWIFNDAGGNKGVTESEPMGIQASVLAYSFEANAPIGDATFYDVEMLSPFEPYDSFYFGVFVDFDIGWLYDDYHSCDTSRHMGIGINGRVSDPRFGQNPPQLGVRFLETPLKPNGRMVGMSAFRPMLKDWSVLDIPRHNPLHFWNYMQGRWKYGAWQTYGGNGNSGSGIPFPWFVPSEPEDSTGWSECNMNNSPFDRKFLMTSGPYHLEAGKPLSFTFTVISAACTGTWDGKCHRRHCIQQASDQVHDFFKAQRPVGASGSKSVARYPKLHPNPTESLLHIDWPEASTGGTLELLNHIGQRVAAWPAPVTQIHIGHLPAGWYLLRYQKSNETWQAPLVKY